MVTPNIGSINIGNRIWNTGASDYDVAPSVMSGMEISFGAESCIEHPEPTTAKVSLRLPKAYPDWMPKMGQVVKVKASFDSTSLPSSRPVVFHGTIDSIVVQDDHKPDPATYVPTNIATNLQNITSLTGWTFRSTNMGVESDATSYASIQNETTVLIKRPAGLTFTMLNPPFSTTYAPSIAVEPNTVYSISIGSRATEAAAIQNDVFDSIIDHILVAEYNSNGQLLATQSVNYTDDLYRDAQFRTQSNTATLKIGDKHYWDPDEEEYSWGGISLSRTFTPTYEAEAYYKINILCSDALAAAGRLRLSDTPWPEETAQSRQARIVELTRDSGVKFASGMTDDQGYFESLGAKVAPRDVDNFSALEAFQLTTMAYGHTVSSINNTVQPSYKLLLPNVLSTNGVATTFNWTGSANSSTSEKKVNGILVRTNLATNPSGESLTNYGITAGTGASTNLSLNQSSPRTGTNFVRGTWLFGGSSTGGVYYQDLNISGVNGTVISGGIWVRYSVSGSANVNVATLNSIPGMGTGIVNQTTTSSVPVVAGEWKWLPFTLTANGTFTGVQVSPKRTTPMPTGSQQDIDGVIIEKAATSADYFDGSFAGFGGAYLSESVSQYTGEPIPVIPASAVEDDTFVIDTSNVINQVAVQHPKYVAVTTTDADYSNPENYEDATILLTNSAMTLRTTPVQRVLKSDWTYRLNVSASGALVEKAERVLYAQARPMWRLSNGLRLVIKEMPDNQDGFLDLIREHTRFGALIRIDGAPSFINEYQRVRGGRIVFGAEPEIELDLEPVEFSGPSPLTRNTVLGDSIANQITIRELQTITAEDLRTVGAR